MFVYFFFFTLSFSASSELLEICIIRHDKFLRLPVAWYFACPGYPKLLAKRRLYGESTFEGKMEQLEVSRIIQVLQLPDLENFYENKKICLNQIEIQRNFEILKLKIK